MAGDCRQKRFYSKFDPVGGANNVCWVTRALVLENVALLLLVLRLNTTKRQRKLGITARDRSRMFTPNVCCYLNKCFDNSLVTLYEGD